MSVQKPTTMPCPTWCIYRAGHDFEADNERAPLWRRHDHPVRWLQWSNVDGGMPAASVWMSQVERADVVDGPILSRPAEVVVETSSEIRLTGPQARQLAAALTDAADLWDAAHPRSADRWFGELHRRDGPTDGEQQLTGRPAPTGTGPDSQQSGPGLHGLTLAPWGPSSPGTTHRYGIARRH